MKKRLIVLSILSFVGTVSCKPTSVNKEDSILINELCITDKSKFEIPVKFEDLSNTEGVIFEKKGVPNSIFYIRKDDKLYLSCKLSNDFKKDKLSVIFSGISYKYTGICEFGKPCSSREGFPLIISTIKTK